MGWRSINIITDKNNHSNLLCPSSSPSGAGSYIRRSNAHVYIRRIYYRATGIKKFKDIALPNLNVKHLMIN